MIHLFSVYINSIMAYGGGRIGAIRDDNWIDDDDDDNDIQQHINESAKKSSIIHNQPNATLCAWIQQLVEIWKRWKKSETVTRLIHSCFEVVPDPYTSALYLMLYSGDFYQSKSNSLAFTVMEEFSAWLLHKRENVIHYLTRELKLEAFVTVQMQRNAKLVKLVYSIYEMAQDNELFYDEIINMISKKQYKEACQSATLLKLHDRFTIEDFVIPLAFQDKMAVAEEFLADSVSHQKNLVIFLDNLISKRALKNEIDKIVDSLKIPEVKLDKMYYKPLSKLVARLVKMYNLPPDLCPNLNQRRNEGALQFLIHKRYQDNSLSIDSWREMVREAVQNDNHLQEELVVLVNLSNDIEEALYWANYFGIPEDKRPENIKVHSIKEREEAKRLNQEQYQESEENWDESVIKYHTFPLPYDSIIVVDTERKFQQFIDSAKNFERIGIDSEWKPYFGTKKNELALMQIAAADVVYILDIMTLGPMFKELWEELGNLLFANDNIMKLGFSFSADMAMIKNSLPHLYSFIERGSGFVDLCSVWRKLTKKYSFTFPFPGDESTSGESLARLVQLCKGCALDKSDQFSNWEQRPLRHNQLVYAALDAYCLLEVYEVMEESCRQQGIPFADVCKEASGSLKSPRKSSKSTRKSAKHASDSSMVVGPPPNLQPVSARFVRIVCDTMIAGLGLQLRKCGVDTVILKHYQSHDHCVKIALDEDRMVITRGKSIYKQLSQHLPPGHCYSVSGENLEEQLKEVLEYFNIVVSKEDVFSRCKICNGNTFIKVSKETMIQLSNAYEKINSYTPDFEVECEGFSSEDEEYQDDMLAPCSSVSEQSPQLQEGVIVNQCRTQKGAMIQIGVIPKPVLNQEKEYLICEDCGRCYWDGSHFNRFINSTLKNIIRTE